MKKIVLCVTVLFLTVFTEGCVRVIREVRVSQRHTIIFVETDLMLQTSDDSYRFLPLAIIDSSVLSYTRSLMNTGQIIFIDLDKNGEADSFVSLVNPYCIYVVQNVFTWLISAEGRKIHKVRLKQPKYGSMFAVSKKQQLSD